eukprot:1872620-Alexandrium_andersonii.AAC.1
MCYRGLQADAWLGCEVEVRSALKVPAQAHGLAPAVWIDARSLDCEGHAGPDVDQPLQLSDHLCDTGEVRGLRP